MASSNLKFGWSALIFFIALGLALESLHLVKLPFYFEVELRRELWTLAHAHGTLLALLNIVFAVGASHFRWAGPALVWASRLLIAGAALVPTGFFLGGIGNSEGDPSLWIVLTPLGALAVLVALLLMLRSVWRPGDGQDRTT